MRLLRASEAKVLTEISERHDATRSHDDRPMVRLKKPFQKATYTLRNGKPVAEGMVLAMVELGVIFPVTRDRLLWDEVDYWRTGAAEDALRAFAEEERRKARLRSTAKGGK